MASASARARCANSLRLSSTALSLARQAATSSSISSPTFRSRSSSGIRPAARAPLCQPSPSLSSSPPGNSLSEELLPYLLPQFNLRPPGVQPQRPDPPVSLPVCASDLRGTAHREARSRFWGISFSMQERASAPVSQPGNTAPDSGSRPVLSWPVPESRRNRILLIAPPKKTGPLWLKKGRRRRR